MSESKSTISVRTADTTAVRKVGIRHRDLEVDVLARNVNIFLGQIDEMLQDTPEDVGKFKLTEFTVSAEISAKGALVLVGTGVEAEGKGGLTFKFERKA